MNEYRFFRWRLGSLLSSSSASDVPRLRFVAWAVTDTLVPSTLTLLLPMFCLLLLGLESKK